MSKTELPTTLRDRVEAFDKPVLTIANTRSEVWHVPQITDSGEITSVCHRTNPDWSCKPLDFTRRGRRRMCGHCRGETTGVGYPDSAPITGDSE
jgi:hypothetical protein